MAENQTFNFTTFEEYMQFLKHEGKNMHNWSAEKAEQFAEYTAERCKDPEFNKKLHEYADKNSKLYGEQSSKRSQHVTIGGNDQENAALIKAKMRLKELQEKKVAAQKKEDKPAKPRIVLDGDAKQNKAVLDALRGKKIPQI